MSSSNQKDLVYTGVQNLSYKSSIGSDHITVYLLDTAVSKIMLPEPVTGKEGFRAAVAGYLINPTGFEVKSATGVA